MSEKNDKELYLNFDEYIRQGDPQKKERAEACAWLLVCKLWMV